MPGDEIEWESTVIAIDFLVACRNKYYLQVYLDNWAYKIIDKQMPHYLDNNRFETNEDWIL